MFLVDTEEGRISYDNEIKGKIARQKPYRRWLEENRIELRGLFHARSRCARARDDRPALRRFRLHARRPADDPGADGRERPGAGRLDGHRHAAGRALRPAQAAVQLLQAVVRPGDQPADRPAARGAGDVADVLHRQAAEPAGRDARALPPLKLATRSSPTKTWPSCAPPSDDDFRVVTLPVLFDGGPRDPEGTARPPSSAADREAEAAVRRGAMP